VSEVRSTLEVLTELVTLENRDVVDVGCGDGALVRRLAGLGARVTGVEVSKQALERARSHPPVAGERYVEGTGQALGLPDASADVVVFMQSLHHVPAEQMDAALAEAARVVRPRGGVYVQEPLAEGAFFDLVALVDDETQVRVLAQRALARAPAAGLEIERELRFDVPLALSGFAALRERIVAADPARAGRFATLDAVLRARYAALAGADGTAIVTLPSVAVLLRRG
jgi:SAM-dependent methyltransferase